MRSYRKNHRIRKKTTRRKTRRTRNRNIRRKMLGGSDAAGSEESSDQKTLQDIMKEQLRKGLESVSDAINHLSNTTGGAIPSVNPSELMSAISNLIQTALSTGMNYFDHQGRPLTYQDYYLSQPLEVFLRDIGGSLDRGESDTPDNDVNEASAGLVRTLTQERNAELLHEMASAHTGADTGAHTGAHTGAGKYPVSEKRKKAKKRTKKLARKKKTKKIKKR